jgi:hypothetical protein
MTHHWLTPSTTIDIPRLLNLLALLILDPLSILILVSNSEAGNTSVLGTECQLENESILLLRVLTSAR